MKKLVIVFLILVLALPVAFADSDEFIESFYLKNTTWVHCELTNSGTPVYYFLFLGENHVCFYTTQMFREDDEPFGRSFKGEWELQPSGMVYAKTGNNTSVTLEFSNDYEKAMDSDQNFIIYYRVSTFDLR